MRATNFKVYIQLARLHRPVGILLLLFPAWWGIALASPGIPSLSILFLFALGAILMRSAGCIYNDIIDKDFDRQVKRTASRPFTANKVSLKEALLVFLLCLGSAAVLLFLFPTPVILTGFIALGLILLYPWMKRITYWPQLFLGITFNMGLIMGWLCLQPTFSIIPFLFYGGAVFWTIGYDTIYAFQDREDDLFVGVKSSALKVSSMPKLFTSCIYGLTLIFWAIGGKIAHLNWIYWFFLCLIILHFIWQIFTLQEDVSDNCLKRFESNTIVGLLLFLGIVFSHLIN